MVTAPGAVTTRNGSGIVIPCTLAAFQLRANQKIFGDARAILRLHLLAGAAAAAGAAAVEGSGGARSGKHARHGAFGGVPRHGLPVVIRWSSGGHQVVIRWSSDGHQVVIRWSSGGHQVVIRGPSEVHQRSSAYLVVTSSSSESILSNALSFRVAWAEARRICCTIASTARNGPACVPNRWSSSAIAFAK